MSIHIPIEERHRLPWHRSLLPLAAAGAAHLIGRLAPRRIRRLLTWCAQAARATSYTEAAAAHQAVVAVSVRCAGHGCPPRSIATALLCRTHGSWPTWHTGVRTIPFTAHAWVEAEGQPVDEPHTTAQTRPLITVAPNPTPCRRGTG
ncbi:MAG: lasso peptide biosynthesis B2 protein [Pseudonocardiaceae bacterium]